MVERNSLSRKLNVSSIGIACSKIVVYWLAGCVLIWVSYGMSMQVYNDSSTTALALEMVMGMSLVTSVLTAGIWLFYLRISTGSKKLWKGLVKVFSYTAAILTAYLSVVLIRRNLWTQDQGMSVYDQFLPVVGKINAEFFSEFNWLTRISHQL